MPKKSTYHHGELREAIIQEAVKQLNEKGVGGVSLRKIADALDVSHAAPYHHFADKNTILNALAERGFAKQSELLLALERQISADSAAKSSVLQLHLLDFVAEYVAFAMAHSAIYKVMYSQQIWQLGGASDALRTQAHQSYRLWQHSIRLCVEKRVFTVPPTYYHDRDQRQQTMQVDGTAEQAVVPYKRVAQAVWSSLHGLCHFAIDGIYVKQEDVIDMAKTTLQLMFANPERADNQ